MNNDFLSWLQTYWYWIVIGIAGIILILKFIPRYKIAPPDTALIISGIIRRNYKVRNPDGTISTKKFGYRIVRGGATFYVPAVQRIDQLDMCLTQVDIKTAQPVPTKEYISVLVDAVANIKIGSDDLSIATAAEQLLHYDSDQIKALAKDVLEGNMREIINLNIQNFCDKDGNVIDTMAARNIAEKEQDKRIAEAEAERFRRQAEADASLYAAQKEAEAIRMKGEAEADAMRLKAEAMQLYGQAAMMEMIADKLPDIARAVSEPLSKTDKIILFGEGGATAMAKDTAGTMLQTFEAVKEAVGLDIPKAIRDVTTGGLVGKAAKEEAEALPSPEEETAEE